MWPLNCGSHGSYLPSPEQQARRKAREQARLRLIAAAPDLLEACKAVLGMAAIWNLDPDKSQNTMNTAFTMLQAAIAKAEGDQT